MRHIVLFTHNINVLNGWRVRVAHIYSMWKRDWAKGRKRERESEYWRCILGKIVVCEHDIKQIIAWFYKIIIIIIIVIHCAIQCWTLCCFTHRNMKSINFAFQLATSTIIMSELHFLLELNAYSVKFIFYETRYTGHQKC